MTRYDKRVQALAIGLSALAGYVDAVGFIQLGGFFVSFMSGNSTRLGVGLIERSNDAALASGLIAVIVTDVIAGAASFSWIGLDSLRRAAAIAGLFAMIARRF